MDKQDFGKSFVHQSPSRALQWIHNQNFTILQRRLRRREERVRHWDTMSPKLFRATLVNIMRDLAWKDMAIMIDSRQQHHLRSLTTSGSQLRTSVMRNEWWPTSIVFFERWTVTELGERSVQEK